MRAAILVLGAFAVGLVAMAACGSDDNDIAAPPVDAGADVVTNTSSSGFAAGDTGAPDVVVDVGPPAPTCPTYQTLCDGKCIPTTDDANHCGDCATKCTGAQACSAGKCADSCQVGSICANRCVDKQSDNAHCGTCGHACGTGEGCVAGSCVKAIVVGPTPGKCTGGGPPIVNTPEQGGCLGELAQKTFRWSLCSCTNINASSSLTADAYDSTKGPYAPGSTGGGIGVNENESTAGDVTVGGDLWSHGTNGVSASGTYLIRHDLRLNGTLSAANTFTVENDARVNGDISSAGAVKVTNELTVPAGKTIGNMVTAGKTTRAPVDFPAPCDCAPAQLVPTVAIVKAHAGTNNDNAAIGLDAGALKTPLAPTRLDLPCGQFYLTSVGGAFPITIAAHGRVALYVDGDIQSASDITFAVDAIGELDVFVTGTVSASGKLTIGSPNYPALSRTYLGTKSGVDLASSVRVAGNFYIGEGKISWAGNSDIYGSLFANDFSAAAPTNIHYDRAVLQAGNSCPGAGGGGQAPACTSCRDCGNNACRAGKCGACETSADCCSPLVCQSGECVAAVK